MALENTKNQDLDKLFEGSERASELLSTMLEIHTAGLKKLEEMKKSTSDIASYRNKNIIKNKARIHKELMHLKGLVAEISESWGQEAIIAGELENLLGGPAPATVQADKSHGGD